MIAAKQWFALFLLACVVWMQSVVESASSDGLSTVGGEFDDPSDDEEGYCAPYNGKVCKTFVKGRQVWYNRDGSGGWLNEQITTALFRDLITDLPDYCRPAAEVSGHGHMKVLISVKFARWIILRQDQYIF